LNIKRNTWLNFYDLWAMTKIRHFENLHILLWLLKDSAWLMEWKTIGILMVLPTVGVAINIAYWARIHRDPEFWLHMAVVGWISANSYWMVCEFMNHVELKYYAIAPFVFGFICAGKYYFDVVRQRLKNETQSKT